MTDFPSSFPINDRGFFMWTGLPVFVPKNLVSERGQGEDKDFIFKYCKKVFSHISKNLTTVPTPFGILFIFVKSLPPLT